MDSAINFDSRDAIIQYGGDINKACHPVSLIVKHYRKMLKVTLSNIRPCIPRYRGVSRNVGDYIVNISIIVRWSGKSGSWVIIWEHNNPLIDAMIGTCPIKREQAFPNEKMLLSFLWQTQEFKAINDFLEWIKE